MSRTVEIRRDSWRPYLNHLAHHAAAPVRIETEGGALGPRTFAERARLDEITLSRNGPPGGLIELALSMDEGDQWDHRIYRPDRMIALVGEHGELECLTIEQSDCGRTLVYFEPPLELDHAHAEALR